MNLINSLLNLINNRRIKTTLINMGINFGEILLLLKKMLTLVISLLNMKLCYKK